MKKKLIILLMMTMGMTIHSMAQTLKVPKFTKIVEVVSSGVNLRKEPNTTSPKLVGWFTGDRSILKNGGIISDPDNFRLRFGWEGETGGKGKPAYAKYLLIVSETPEWYYACPLIDNLELSQASPLLVYVSKKVCKVRNIKPLTLNNFENYCTFSSGKYKDFSCFCDFVESAMYQTLFLGILQKDVGFGWTVVTDDFEKVKKNPDGFVTENVHSQKAKVVIGKKMKFYGSRGESMIEGEGIVTYDYYPDEYMGESYTYLR